MRLGCKGLPGTNAVAYFAGSIRKEENIDNVINLFIFVTNAAGK